jgi:hypothetical protein
MYFRNNTIDGPCKWTEQALFRIEGAMAALVKSKPGPIFFTIIEIEKRKIHPVKNQVNTEIHVRGFQGVFYVYGFSHDLNPSRSMVHLAFKIQKRLLLVVLK